MRQAARDRVHFLGFVILLPLLMATVGGWEVYRDAGLGAAYEIQAGEIQAGEAQAGEAQAGRMADPAQTMTAARSADSLHQDALVSRVRMVFAWTTVAGGVVSLLAGLCGILLARWGAARAAASRDALLAAFSRVAGAVPSILGMTTGGFCLAVSGIVMFELGGLWFLDRVGRLELRVLVLGLVLAGAVLWVAARTLLDLRKALTRLASQPRPVLARAVPPEVAPGLWNFVAGIAGQVRAEMPDHILIGLTQGFFVTSSDMQPVPGGDVLHGRILHLAAGPLAVFDRAEITAVVSHELAHFTGRDTVYSQQFLPLYHGMVQSLDAVASGLRPIRKGGLPLRASVMLGQRMLEAFHGAVRHWGRLREFEADKAMLAAVSPAAAASALLRSGAVGPLVAHVLASGAARPGEARDMVAEIVRYAEAQPLPDPRQFLANRQAHPFDTHPPASQRIAALGVEIDDTLLAHASRTAGPSEAAFASSLFADWEELRRLLSADALAVASHHDARERAALRAAVSAAEDATLVHEAAPIPPLLASSGIGVAGLLLGAVFLAAGSLEPGSRNGLLTLALGSIILIAGVTSCVSVVVALRNARRGAIMTLTLAGLQVRGMAEIVPWSSIRDVRLSWRRTVTARFDLSSTATMPSCGHWPRRVRIDRRKRVLLVSGLRPRGMKPMELLVLLTR